MRPQITRMMANACNAHLKVQHRSDSNNTFTYQIFPQVCSPEVEFLQNEIGLISEMFHTSSLYHDDVIDKALTRRGKESVNSRWNQSYSVLAGDYILGVSSLSLARTNNPEVRRWFVLESGIFSIQVIESMFQVLNDLVVGEFQQMMTRY